MPLKVSDGIGAWIKDFQKSDAPQFKGKSEKERRDQAIAAYLSAKRGNQKEGVDEAKRVVHSDRPDSLKSLRIMHPKPAGEKPPFEGPYRKAGEVTKDKFGNVVKNKARHLARKAARRAADLDEAAPKPLNRSDHTHTVHIDGEGRYRVKAKSMDHAKKVAFKQAGISKLHGHPTMEPKTRIYGESVNEETNFAVNIEGLPMMFMSAMGPGELKQKLRKIVKQPSMIQSVKRVTDADVKKTFRLKAQGRDEEEQMDEAKLDELSPALLKRYDDASAKKHAMPGGGSTYKNTRTARNRAVGSIRSLKRQAGFKGKTDKVSRADHMKAINQKNEAKLDELSPATMNRYKKAAANSAYNASQKYARVAQTSGLGKKYKDKELAAADKIRNKRLSGLNRAARITGTHGQQDENK